MVRNLLAFLQVKHLVVNSFQIIIFADGSQLHQQKEISYRVVNSFQIIIFADGSQHS